jgi:hypothetical protein
MRYKCGWKLNIISITFFTHSFSYAQISGRMWNSVNLRMLLIYSISKVLWAVREKLNFSFSGEGITVILNFQDTYIYPQAIYSFLFLASLMVSSLICVIYKAGFFTFSLHQVIENIHCKRVCGHNNIWKARMPRKKCMLWVLWCFKPPCMQIAGLFDIYMFLSL